jgi:methionine-rich copper-binding protein CopC
MNVLTRFLSIPLLALALLVLPIDTPAEAAFHFGLSRSSPEAESSVAAPPEVKLWFTEEPQEGTVSIRLLEAEDAGIHVMDPVQDSEDPRVFSVALHGTVPAGTYTVSWRGMGADGHVVRDTFQFTVASR